MRVSTVMAGLVGVGLGTAGAWLCRDQLRSFFSTGIEQARAAVPTFHEKFQDALRELKVEDFKQGNGLAAKPGDRVRIHYVAKLSNGTEFDSSVRRNDPLTFVLGKAEALPGLDRGVEGMRVGGRRKLTVPPFLAYGEKGVATLVPPSETLMFEVALLDIQGNQLGTAPAKKSVKRISKPSRHSNTRPIRFRAQRSRSAVSYR